MVAYNFMAQFYPKLRSGEKAQTIRPLGKRRHVRKGERIQIYTGMRTKGCLKVFDPDPICTEVSKIHISTNAVQTYVPGHLPWVQHNLEEMAKADGFDNFDRMREWFIATHGLPFIGLLIKWRRYDGN